MRNWRVLTWVIVVINIIFAIWIIGGLGAASESCVGMSGDELTMCQAGTAVGTGLGVTALLFVWFIVNGILGFLWLVTGSKGRECPTCGVQVKRGRTTCRKCGHDFASGSVTT